MTESTRRRLLRFDRESWTARAIAAAERAERQVNRRRLSRMGLALWRRWRDVDGAALAMLITFNLFLIVLPVLIMAVAYEAWLFGTRVDLADVMVRRLMLSGRAADLLQHVIASARQSRAAATVLGVLSYLVFGGELVRRMQQAFNRPWDPDEPDRTDPWRGTLWFVASGVWLLATMIPVAAFDMGGRPGQIPMLGLQTFLFWWLSSKWLTRTRMRWRHHLPGSIVGAVLVAAVATLSRFLLANWMETFERGFGQIGVVMALVWWLLLLGYVACFVPVFNAVWHEEFHRPDDTADAVETPEL